MKILIVDDNAAMRRLATLMLRLDPQMAVSEADSGPACLEIAAMEKFDVILMDISMPDMDGIETCARLRASETHAATRIIACTAHAGTRDGQSFLVQGFTGVLTKPFLIAELYSAIGADKR